ncbi:hypothetical protein YIM_16830 [Amycolatopsis sp. YIM 10]|nr:hypothetical protein YIM_16830 [Amycolatopsis sp. YIM 10]
MAIKKVRLEKSVTGTCRYLVPIKTQARTVKKH